MRIGIDARLMYHQPAGISRYTLHLLRALATQTSREDFIVFQHRRHRQPIIQQRNFKRATLFAPAHGKLEQAMLPLELLRFSLDLLHCPDFIPPLYSPVPSVITVHDLAFLHWPRFLTESSAAYYGQIDRAVRKARHIIVPSQSTQQDLIRLLGVHESKVSVIYEAADPRFMPLELSRTRTEVCRRHHIPDSYIFFVSTLEPRKNVDGLLHAFRALRDRYHIADTGLVLAGSKGWLYEDTLALVEKLDLGECTFFLGRVSDEELHQLYVGPL